MSVVGTSRPSIAVRSTAAFESNPDVSQRPPRTEFNPKLTRRDCQLIIAMAKVGRWNVVVA